MDIGRAADEELTNTLTQLDADMADISAQLSANDETRFDICWLVRKLKAVCVAQLATQGVPGAVEVVDDTKALYWCKKGRAELFKLSLFNSRELTFYGESKADTGTALFAKSVRKGRLVRVQG